MKTTGTMILALALAACHQEPAVSPPTTASATASTADITSARAFLSHIYTGYHPDGALEEILPDEEVYAPALLAAMQANREAYSGEVGYLNGDPLCDCQDFAQDLRHLDFAIEPVGDGRLQATVALEDPEHPLDLRLTLQRDGARWRVADIATLTEPSLLQALERDTRAAGQELPVAEETP